MSKKIFKDFKGLTTDRVFLRKITLDDAEDIFSFTSNPKTSEVLTWNAHKDIHKTKSFIQNAIIDKYEKNLAAQWGIELKENRKIIGIAGFINYWEEHDKAEITFVLSPDYWGKGYMPEALNAILDYGFKEMGLHRIEAKCEIDNYSSEKALQKIGMKLEGCKYDFLVRKGQYRSFKFYAKLSEKKVR